MLGYDAAMRFLSSKTEEERSLIQAMATTALDLERQRDVDRANQIANAVGKMLGG